MAVTVPAERFDELVDAGLDLIPDELFSALDNVVILVRDRHEDEPGLLGLYEGVALTDRDTSYAGLLPDTISIFRQSLCEFCDTEDQLIREVAVTVIHEVAHHFGIEEERLAELGWD